MKTLAKTQLLDICPAFDRIEEASIADAEGLSVGWHSSVLDRDGRVLSSGCHSERDTARRIALAELIERSLMKGIRASGQVADFALDRFPSSCGFAAGFEREPTRLRSIAEALERWAWSKWIDQGLSLPEVRLEAEQLTPLARFHFQSFESVRAFSGVIQARLPDLSAIEMKLGVVIGLEGNGAFPGSRVCALGDSPWEHALLEAWRHKLIFERHSSAATQPDLAYARIVHFGSNVGEALDQIPASGPSKWPVARLPISKEAPTRGAPYFFFRSLCSDYQGWHEGSERRFVY